MKKETIIATARAYWAKVEVLSGGKALNFRFPSEWAADHFCAAHRESIPWCTGRSTSRDFVIHFDRPGARMERENELIAACKSLHDALSEIMEDPEISDPMYATTEKRNIRAQAWRAIRKSFRTLAKLPGGLEE